MTDLRIFSLGQTAGISKTNGKTNVNKFGGDVSAKQPLGPSTDSTNFSLNARLGLESVPPRSTADIVNNVANTPWQVAAAQFGQTTRAGLDTKKTASLVNDIANTPWQEAAKGLNPKIIERLIG